VRKDVSKKRQKVERVIDRFKQELKNLGISAERIILFGSYAKGNPREDSDIDLVVISDDFKKLNLRERLEILGLAAGRVFEPIEALGYTKDEIKTKKESFVGEIISSTSAIAY
jgi:predicted nucleotidyltransferase